MKGGAAASPAPPLVDEFLERLRVEDGSSPLTIAAYRRDLRRLVDFLRARRRTLETARPDDLVAHLEALRRNGLGPRSLARGLAAMRGLYKFGRSANLLRENPAALLETPRLPRRLPRALSKRDATALVESPGDAGLLAWRDRAMLELLYGSGLRASELVGLRPADVDLQAQILVCRGKRDRQRMVPIGDAARRALVDISRAGATATRPGRRSRSALREHPRPPSRPPDPLADRADPRPGCRSPRRVPARAPPLVREPSPRGRGRSPLGPGPARTCRHRDDRDLHAPAHRRRAPALPHVPPASVRMEPRGGPETRRAG